MHGKKTVCLLLAMCLLLGGCASAADAAQAAVGQPQFGNLFGGKSGKRRDQRIPGRKIISEFVNSRAEDDPGNGEFPDR